MLQFPTAYIITIIESSKLMVLYFRLFVGGHIKSAERLCVVKCRFLCIEIIIDIGVYIVYLYESTVCSPYLES